MKNKTYFLFFFVLAITSESFAAWADITITTDRQLSSDAQFIVVNVNGTDEGIPHVMITGGCIGTLIVNGSSKITMQGGTISNDFWVFDPENLDDDDVIRCPYGNNIYLNETSTMVMSGGIVEGHISIAAGAKMDVYGLTFQELPDGRGNVRLLGYWQNNKPLDLYFAANSFDRVVLHAIPEPATILLIGLGGLLIRRKT